MKNHTECPVLISQTGEFNTTRHVLNQESTVLGRNPDCDLVINDRQVSRRHLLIRKTPRGYEIEDLGSKNGTFLNGVPVRDREILQDGDVIQVALASKFTFLGTESTIPLSLADAAQMGLGRLRMDVQAHRVWVNDQELEPPLSLPQFRLLELLYSNPERVVSRDEVVQVVWSDSEAEGVSEQAIDALVRRVRDRLHEIDPGHNYVITVRGHGFRLDNPL